MNSKIYRCGWCGNHTDKIGRTIPIEKFKKQDDLVERYGDGKTHLVEGGCCIHEQMGHQKMRVTRDMAIDAGDPSLEGQLI